MLHRLNSARWRFRWPLKAGVFLAVLMLVEYPDPRFLFRQIQRLRNMDAVIDPHAPELAEFEARFRARQAAARQATKPARQSRVATASAPSGHEVQRAVERFVYDNVRYDWDWNVWSVADYMPTVSEMFARAREYPDGLVREDCDGRAVMAASLLRRLGYDAHLVTDVRHVWVQVSDPRHPAAKPLELMGPGRAKTIVSSAKGNRLDWSTLTNLPVALSFGVAVFPWGREAIIFATLMLLLLHPGVSRRTTAIGVLLAFAGWQLLRAGVVSVGQAGQPGYAWEEHPTNALFGLGYILIGCGVIIASSWRARRATVNGQATRLAEAG